MLLLVKKKWLKQPQWLQLKMKKKAKPRNNQLLQKRPHQQNRPEEKEKSNKVVIKITDSAYTFDGVELEFEK